MDTKTRQEMKDMLTMREFTELCRLRRKAARLEAMAEYWEQSSDMSDPWGMNVACYDAIMVRLLTCYARIDALEEVN